MNFCIDKTSWKPCNKCGKNNYKPQNMNCDDCVVKFFKRKCYKHHFSIMNLQSDRTIKCSTEECKEVRKA